LDLDFAVQNLFIGYLDYLSWDKFSRDTDTIAVPLCSISKVEQEHNLEHFKRMEGVP